MNSAKIGILENADHVGLDCLLDRQNCRLLESQVRLILAGHLPHQPLKRKLSEQQFRTFLKFANFPQSYSAGAKAMRPHLFYASLGGGGLFARALVREHFAGGFGPHVFSGGLFCAGHVVWGGGGRLREDDVEKGKVFL